MIMKLRCAVAGLSVLAAVSAAASTPASASPRAYPAAASSTNAGGPAPYTNAGGPAPYTRHFHPRASDPHALREAWHAWKALRERDYNLKVNKTCFCAFAPPVVTKVRNGRVVAVVYANRRHHEIARKGWTMDRLFFLQRHAYHQADKVHLRYTKNGVPRRIAIDYDVHAIDDEVSYHSSLWRLPHLLGHR